MEYLLGDFVEGRRTHDSVVGILLNEMGRGSRILVVDENLLDLDAELSDMNYTTDVIRAGTEDQQIKMQLHNRVFITQNGRDFCDPKEMLRYRYGLIWVTSNPDTKVLAQRVEQALKQTNFKRHLVQVVKI